MQKMIKLTQLTASTVPCKGGSHRCHHHGPSRSLLEHVEGWRTCQESRQFNGASFISFMRESKGTGSLLVKVQHVQPPMPASSENKALLSDHGG